MGIRGRGVPGGVVFVGIGPGPEENNLGRCFVGRSGRRLSVLAYQHLGDKTPFGFVNLVGCMPPKNVPPVAYTRICWPNFGLPDLLALQPKCIVLLGNQAADFLIGKEKGSTVSSRRGRMYSFNGIPTIVTYHPAATLRAVGIQARESLSALSADISRAGKIARDELRLDAPDELRPLGDLPTGDVVVDIETTSLRPWLGEVLLVGAVSSDDPTRAWISDKPEPVGPMLDGAKRLIGWNFAFDSQWLPESVFTKEWVDGMILHGILYPDRLSRSLKVVGPEVTGIAYRETLADGIINQPEKLKKYLSLDLYQTAVCTKTFESRLVGHPAEGYSKWIMTLARRLAQMQRYGCRLNRSRLAAVISNTFHQQANAALGMKLLADSVGLPLTIESIGGYRYKLSKTELIKVVYDGFKLPIQKTEKGSPSLSNEARDHLKQWDESGILGLFEEYLTAQKNITTYLLPSVEDDVVDPLDLMHPSPHLVLRDKKMDSGSEGRGGGAVTGRIVWLDPSLQVYPGVDRKGKWMSCRSIIGSRFDGGFIGVSDLSQIEPRVLAWLSGDERLIENYQIGGDFYRLVMSLALGIPEDEVTKDQRQVGKTVVLSILYGAGESNVQETFRLDGGLSISFTDARQFIRRFRDEMPMLTEWAQSIRDKVDEGIPLTAPTGFTRSFPIEDDAQRTYRQAINFQVQHFASCINHAILLSMPMHFDGIHCIPPTVHDSLSFDCEKGASFEQAIAPYYSDAQRIIQRAFGVDFTVPIKYETKAGEYWQ